MNRLDRCTDPNHLQLFLQGLNYYVEIENIRWKELVMYILVKGLPVDEDLGHCVIGSNYSNEVLKTN